MSGVSRNHSQFIRRKGPGFAGTGHGIKVSWFSFYLNSQTGWMKTGRNLKNNNMILFETHAYAFIKMAQPFS